VSQDDLAAARVVHGGRAMSNERYYEIDLLRFLAALSVVLYHYTFRGFAADDMSPLAFPELGAVFRYSYLGVNLFFIISGFVILLTALNRDARGFVESRVIRLFPAYWFCVSLTFVVTLAFGAPRFSVSVPQYLANLTMVHELFGIASIDGVYWTLLVELKFYFLVWILVLLRQIHHAQWYLGVWLVLSVALHVLHAPKWLSAAFIPGYSYFFIAGALFLLIRLHGPSVARLAMLVASYLLAIRFAIAESRGVATYYRAELEPSVVVVLVTLFFVVFTAIAFRRSAWLNRPRFLVLGVLTYPLYLLHQHLGFITFGQLQGWIDKYWLLAGTITGMLLLSYLMHRYVEIPVGRGLKWVFANIGKARPVGQMK